MSMLKELREDWEYSGELTDRTGISETSGLNRSTPSLLALQLKSILGNHYRLRNS